MSPQSHGALTSHDAQNNESWWPSQLNLRILHQNHPASDPTLGNDYRAGLSDLDFDALVADVDALMTDSQEWWPADFGHYGPLFIRMAWHAAGTYRVTDGRGGANSGAQRFAPLNSWPDNGNLDKARRLLWPVKSKYGNKISWADLFVLAGNRALEVMGFETFGFAFGRSDIHAPEDDIFWGPEDEWLADDRYSGTFENGDRALLGDLAAVQMGLIYVNPEGPNGVPDALRSAHDIRETFSRMAMNDEETVALVVGGHTFGKMHGNGPESAVGAEPEGGSLEHQGFGWHSSHGSGKGADTITSGLEGAWTPTPTTWDNSYLETLFTHEWELVQSPAGANQWQPKSVRDGFMVPPVQPGAPETKPTMSTADMAMITDPDYLEISKRFHENPDQSADAFARAWFKLLHRDMGPKARYIGPYAPTEDMKWQDNNPDGKQLDDAEIAALRDAIRDAGFTADELVGAAWASAATYRKTDFRGGANGARVALSPQIDWDVNVRTGVPAVVRKLGEIAATSGTGASLADTIVLAGNVGIEMAAAAAGRDLTVPFTSGRGDATQDSVDVESFQWLEPKADGFRNYVGKSGDVPAEHLLIERAFQLGLSAPEMTALVGGLRAIGVNAEGTTGQLTERSGQLTNDFFVNLLDMAVVWEPVGEGAESFEGKDRSSGDVRWTASRVDLVFGSNSQLRSIAEIFGASDGQDQMERVFVEAWVKVMENDLFATG